LKIGELLARNFLFRNLDPDVIERIAALGSTVELAGNQVLFLKGDEGDALYGVLGGRIRISSGDADGKEIILNIIDPGDIFGEIALLDGKPRTADASAMAPSQLLRVQRSDFLGLMAAEPRLTQHLMEMVCDRIRKTSEMLEDSAFLDLPARLAKRLLSLAKYYGEADTDTAITGIQISQAELGQLMGTSRESINKHLQFWRSRDWITLGRGRVTINQPAALQNLIERDDE
jgi:CRP/FNR family cyclic AMP-dependent transcriptional regulator